MVVEEARRWGLHDTLVDPGETLMRLVAQSSRRASEYSRRLGVAHELQERAGGGQDVHGDDLDDVLSGGVRALIGLKRSADTSGNVYSTGEEVIRGLTQLEGQERDRCARLAKLALDAGIADRQVRLAERHWALLAETLRAVLDDGELGSTGAQRRLLPRLLRRQLTP